MGLILLFTFAAAVIVVLGTIGLAVRMHRPDRRTLAYAIARKLPTEPADVELSGVEATFTFADGSSSPGWVIDGADPAGPMVVVLHGWTSSRFSALRRAAQLAPYAARVVVFDLRAHGDSTATVCMFGKLECDDIVHVVEQVDGMARETRPVVLAGSSMGAGFALMAAVRKEALRERTVGVIADGPYRWPMEPVANHLRSLGWPAQPLCLLVGLYLALRLRMTCSTFDRAGLAAGLRCPLLVLHGSDDPISPVASARAIAGAARHGTLVEFPGGGHGGLAMLNEERYTRALADFFAGLRGADGSDKITGSGLSAPSTYAGATRLEHPDPA